MREPETRDINGCTYTVTPMPTFEGLRLMQRLVKIIGPAAASAAKPGDVFAAIGAGLGELAARLEGDDLEQVVKALAKHSQVTDEGGKTRPLAAAADMHFQGRYEDLFAWMAFALEVNFGPLLGWLRSDAFARARAAVPGGAAAK